MQSTRSWFFFKPYRSIPTYFGLEILFSGQKLLDEFHTYGIIICLVIILWPFYYQLQCPTLGISKIFSSIAMLWPSQGLSSSRKPGAGFLLLTKKKKCAFARRLFFVGEVATFHFVTNYSCAHTALLNCLFASQLGCCT